MKNHYVAIFGGFLGYLLTSFLITDGDNKGMYQIMGGCAGVFIGYFIAGLLMAYKQQGNVLVKKFQKQNPVGGKNINDVIEAVGGYSSKQAVKITDRNNEMGAYYNFKDGGYEIQLLVGADDIIIGVSKEILNGKQLI
jgi:hypothetical protein